MVRSAQVALVASFTILSSWRSSSETTALAFAPLATLATRKSAGFVRAASPSTTSLSHQAALKDYAAAAQDFMAAAPHVDDSNVVSIMRNPAGLPVLVDCYVSACMPCQMMERSLASALPGRADDVLFCKWDAERRDSSQRFLDLMRERGMTFRKLPTLVLFVDGAPVAMRSGLATPGQIGAFLEENLAGGRGAAEEEVGDLSGERLACVLP